MKLGLTSTTRRIAAHDASAIAVLSRRVTNVPSEPEDVAAAPVKKERNAAETQRRILDAARAEFAAKGFDGARLGTIARAANVQQALIHHYFVDKEGLHRDVMDEGLTAMTRGVIELLPLMNAPAKKPKKKAKKRSVAELRALAEAFVDVLHRFFVTNGDFIAILRHEAGRNADSVTKIVGKHVTPVFEGIVAGLEQMRTRGEIKKNVDAKHLILSAMAMVAFPFQDEPFVAGIWPADWRAPHLLAERKEHVVEMILARIAP